MLICEIPSFLTIRRSPNLGHATIAPQFAKIGSADALCRLAVIGTSAMRAGCHRLMAAASSAARLLIAASLLLCTACSSQAEELSKEDAATKAEQLFLDRLMASESGGREFAKNSASSALGPFQFINSTFLDVISRYFPELTEGKSDAEILAFRVDTKTARDAALAYTRANAIFLKERGVATRPAHLRLAFLVGPSGAVKVIAAEPETPVSSLLSKAALTANPFLQDLTAKQLIERAEREAAGLPALPTPVSPDKQPSAKPEINIRCTLARTSCRKWVQLAKRRAARKARSGGKIGADDVQSR
jgi:hypothetical protein